MASAEPATQNLAKHALTHRPKQEGAPQLRMHSILLPEHPVALEMVWEMSPARMSPMEDDVVPMPVTKTPTLQGHEETRLLRMQSARTRLSWGTHTPGPSPSASRQWPRSLAGHRAGVPSTL
jgi:hypothetical protein